MFVETWNNTSCDNNRSVCRAPRKQLHFCYWQFPLSKSNSESHNRKNNCWNKNKITSRFRKQKQRVLYALLVLNFGSKYFVTRINMGVREQQQQQQQQPLLASTSEQNQQEELNASSLLRQTWLESKKLWAIAGPSIFSRLAMFSMTVITQSFSGHLSDLDLAAISIASTVIIAITFGFLVLPFPFSSFLIFHFHRHNYHLSQK